MPARWRTALTLGAALLWLAALAGTRPMMLPDEGRYVGVAWEMLRSGDWLTPTLDGLPYFHKPPLFYWITAASMSIFGSGDMAGRAAPILGAWVGAAAAYLFARRWWGEREARLALLVLMAQPLYFVGGQFANLDMLVAGCITASVLALAHAALRFEAAQPQRGWLLVGYAAAALGMLAKGLIGVVLPALVVGTWLIVGRRWRTLGHLLSLPGVLIFLAVAAPWFWLMQIRYPDFLHYLFVVHHFQRYASGGFNNAQPIWFYPALLLAFTLPWWPWLANVWRALLARDARHRDTRVLLIVSVVVVVLFFSLPQSKLVGYILSALPPLAMLAAEDFAASARQAGTGWVRWWRAALVAGTLVSLGVIVTLSLHPIHSTRELALLLGQQRQPAEPVFMIGEYYFDLPRYARLAQPVAIVERWDRVAASNDDNWRKELSDAATFAPERAVNTLIHPDAFRDALCRAGPSWIVAPDALRDRHPALADASPVATVRGTTLWRVDPKARADGC